MLKPLLVKRPRLASIYALVILVRATSVSLAQETPVQMRMDIELDKASARQFENFTFRVRISNPNSFSVTLPGFEMGYIEPQVHLLRSDGESRHLYYGAMDGARTKVPVVIAPNGAIEHHRFLYDGFSFERWPDETGLFDLAGRSTITHCQIGSNDLRPIEWQSQPVNIRIEPALTTDREAFQFLQQQVRERREAIDSGNFLPENVFEIKLFREFLRRFGNTAYAPEIRNEFAILFLTLEKKERAQIDANGLEDEFEECLLFCLDKGGAYESEILRWDENQTQRFVEFALMKNRKALLRRLIENIDRKYPNDAVGRFYRRVILKGATESREAARSAADELRTEFPNSSYVKKLDLLLKNLDRIDTGG